VLVSLVFLSGGGVDHLASYAVAALILPVSDDGVVPGFLSRVSLGGVRDGVVWVAEFFNGVGFVEDYVPFHLDHVAGLRWTVWTVKLYGVVYSSEIILSVIVLALYSSSPVGSRSSSAFCVKQSASSWSYIVASLLLFQVLVTDCRELSS
jgi:hypothetical protein